MAYKRNKDEDYIYDRGIQIPETPGLVRAPWSSGEVVKPTTPGYGKPNPNIGVITPVKPVMETMAQPNVPNIPVSTYNAQNNYPAQGGSSGGSGAGNAVPASAAPLDFTGSSNGVNVNNATQAEIRARMNANSIAWWEADEAGRAALEAENRALAAMLGDGVTFDPETGYWSGTADNEAIYDPSSIGAKPEWTPPDIGSRPSWTAPDLGSRPTYDSAYSDMIAEKMNQLLGRDPFSYDAETDPLFQQYRETYTREGNRAMDSTLAEVASGAGGMNSYAVAAAQQANNYYMAQLSDKIPELQQLAYQMYLDEIGLNRADLGNLMDLDSMYYGRHRDEVNDWYNDRDFSYGQYRDQMSDWYNDRDFSYGQYRDQINDWYNDRDFNYGQYRDDVEDSRYDQEWEYNTGLTDSEVAYERAWDLLNAGVMPSEELLAAAGITVEQAQSVLNGMGGGGGYYGGADNDEEVEWGEGYNTQQGANGVAPSEWGYVKNNILTNLRAQNWANVEAYLDQIADQLSQEQWNEIAALLRQYNYPDVPTY